ncbi:hypothetical protein Plhal703r1_c34g0126711 [Plasmopara halstedii]
MSLLFSSSNPFKMSQSAADQLRKAAAAVGAGGQSEYTRFRVFGKVCSVDEALDFFGQICAVETIPELVYGRDCSCFAIYRKDEMIMNLRNQFNVKGEERTAQFSAAHLQRVTSQRFACMRVSLQSPRPANLESIIMNVYQCFPTPQSAVRFARQGALPTQGALIIVPLFEWITLAELQRFDARNNDLAQELELAMCRGGHKKLERGHKNNGCNSKTRNQ